MTLKDFLQTVARIAGRPAPRLRIPYAVAWLAGAAPADGAPYDLVLMDPPYRQGLCERALELLAARRATWLAKDGLVVAQADRREALAERHGDLAQADRRVYSETVVAFYRPSLLD